MGFDEDHVVPHLVHLSMRQPRLTGNGEESFPPLMVGFWKSASVPG